MSLLSSPAPAPTVWLLPALYFLPTQNSQRSLKTAAFLPLCPRPSLCLNSSAHPCAPHSRQILALPSNHVCGTQREISLLYASSTHGSHGSRTHTAESVCVSRRPTGPQGSGGMLSSPNEGETQLITLEGAPDDQTGAERGQGPAHVAREWQRPDWTAAVSPGACPSIRARMHLSGPSQSETKMTLPTQATVCALPVTRARIIFI